MGALGQYATLARWILGLAVCATLFIGGYHHGVSREQGKTAAVTAKFDAYKARMVELTEKSAAAAKKAQEEYRDLQKLAESSYQAGRDSAQLAQAVLVDDLRAGTVRLRKLWQGCVSAPASDEAGTTAGRADDSADLRSEAAGRIIGLGDAADNQVTWLQAELTATRKLAESCGKTE